MVHLTSFIPFQIVFLSPVVSLPSLTFLNITQLTRQGADLETKLEELQIINQSFKENDKVKQDALAHLSDQLLVVSERIQQLEKKQSHYSNTS